MDPEFAAGWQGDKAHSHTFDNTKIKSIAPGWQAQTPFWRGVADVVAWHEADPARQVVDERFTRLFDDLIARAH